MNKDKAKKTIQIIVMILFVIIMGIVTYCLIPVIKSLPTQEGRMELQEKVKSYGVFAPGVYVLICMFQVIIAIIPGEPLEIAGGVLFGAFGGFILCLIGITIGSILVYYLVKIIGRPLINAIMGKEKYNKLEFLHNEKKLEVIIFVLFLIPGTPKDALTYFVPITKIKPSKYFLYSSLARIPSVISSTIIGANLSKGNFTMGIIIFSITAAIGFVGILFNNKLLGGFKQKAKRLNKNIKSHKKKVDK